MANFTTEETVRNKFQLTDTTLVPASIVIDSIDEAHAEILRHLDPAFDVSPAAIGLTLGETLLAGACLLRSIAAKDAFEQKEVSIGGQQIAEGSRFESLLALATLTEERAWRTLEPFLIERPARVVASSVDSTPILGEG